MPYFGCLTPVFGKESLDTLTVAPSRGGLASVPCQNNTPQVLRFFVFCKASERYICDSGKWARS